MIISIRHLLSAAVLQAGICASILLVLLEMCWGYMQARHRIDKSKTRIFRRRYSRGELASLTHKVTPVVAVLSSQQILYKIVAVSYKIMENL